MDRTQQLLILYVFYNLQESWLTLISLISFWRTKQWTLRTSLKLLSRCVIAALRVMSLFPVSYNACLQVVAHLWAFPCFWNGVYPLLFLQGYEAILLRTQVMLPLVSCCYSGKIRFISHLSVSYLTVLSFSFLVSFFSIVAIPLSVLYPTGNWNATFRWQISISIQTGEGRVWRVIATGVPGLTVSHGESPLS